MRIVLTNPFFKPYGGGIECHVEQLARYFSKEHDVTVVTSRTSEKFEDEEYRVVRIPCIQANMPLVSPPPMLLTPAAITTLMREASSADILHLHNRWYPDYLIGAVLAKRSSGKPLFFTAHEPAELKVSLDIDVIGFIYNNLLTRPLLGNSSLFCVSRAVAQTFKESFSKEALRVVYNGVDTKRFSPKVSGESFRKYSGIDSPYIMFVGRLVKQKGIDKLIQALAKSKTGLKLVVVGRGTEWRELKKLARRAGISDDVKFITEFLSDELLTSAYAGCEFFVLPSIWEAFGIVLVEAMACGKCCIGTDAGGIPEVIGDTGVVVKRGDVDALAKSIAKLHNDAVLRKRLENRARKRVLENFTWDKVAEKTLDGYREIVGF